LRLLQMVMVKEKGEEQAQSASASMLRNELCTWRFGFQKHTDQTSMVVL
jgi:hypothetical protein